MIESIVFLISSKLYFSSDIQDRKKTKIVQWDAFKRAINMYKKNLDIHISLEEHTDGNQIRFDFFTHNEETKDKYFVKLLHNKNEWTGKTRNVYRHMRVYIYNVI